MATQSRAMAKPQISLRSGLPLIGLPAAISGFGMGLVFIFMATNLSMDTLENISIAGLCIMVSTLFWGMVGHLIGEALFVDDPTSGRTRLIKLGAALTIVLNSLLWVVMFGVGSAVIVNLNPEEFTLVKSRMASLKTFEREKPATAFPSSPSSGGRGGQRSVFANANTPEDPNRMKSSPSRYDKNGNLKPAPVGTQDQQQAARDVQVVDTLKSAGFRVDSVVTAPPVKPAP